MILKSIIFLLIIFILILSICYFLLYKNFKKIKYDVSKIYLAIKRLRYGNIHIRVEDLNDKIMENAVNRLFETIYDREMMIKEYQNNLSKKNLSLEKIIKQEQEMLQIKEDFTATLTHDMKVPVIAELNAIEYLLNGRFGELNDNQIKVLNLMKTSNKELKELIENILEVYKLEQQKIKLNLQNTVLNTFLKAIINEMKLISEENFITIDFIYDKTKNIMLNIDPFQLKRVIKNLIQNAISFSKKGDKVIVKAVSSELTTKIMIINKGFDISKNDLENIFNKYYAGYSKFRKAGTGLGLYISKQIMLAHSGNIEIKDFKDGNTTFVLTLNNF